MLPIGTRRGDGVTKKEEPRSGRVVSRMQPNGAGTRHGEAAAPVALEVGHGKVIPGRRVGRDVPTRGWVFWSAG